ncbi:MAG TPA: hypothetical protein VIK72_10975 [Clostridiaceae bacterium]
MKNRKVSEEFTFAHRCSNRAMDFVSEYKDNYSADIAKYGEEFSK